jgi:hypothetical protein
MIHLSLKQWSGKFESDAVLRKIRRTIAHHVARGECVVALDYGAIGLTVEVRKILEEGWPDGKVLWSRIHPTLGGPRARAERRRHP